jgi:hypothetical protein
MNKSANAVIVNVAAVKIANAKNAIVADVTKRKKKTNNHGKAKKTAPSLFLSKMSVFRTSNLILHLF